jgi:hypothetical protein
MPDIIDGISNGAKYECPYCKSVFEDIDPGVAFKIRQGHIRRKHPFEEE